MTASAVRRPAVGVLAILSCSLVLLLLWDFVPRPARGCIAIYLQYVSTGVACHANVPHPCMLCQRAAPAGLLGGDGGCERSSLRELSWGLGEILSVIGRTSKEEPPLVFSFSRFSVGRVLTIDMNAVEEQTPSAVGLSISFALGLNE